MTPATHRKIAIVFIIVFIMIIMFGVAYDLFVSLVHILFELFEYSFEILIEYVFHTDHHQSEIILINLSIFLVPLGLYGLWRGLLRLKGNLIVIWLMQKTSITYYWQTLTTLQKIKQVTIYAIGFIGLLFLLTLFI
jgi:hypothetical protein